MTDQTEIRAALEAFNAELAAFGSRLHEAAGSGEPAEELMRAFGELMAAWGAAYWRIRTADASRDARLAALEKLMSRSQDEPADANASVDPEN